MVEMTIPPEEDIEYIRDMVLSKFPLLGVTMSKLTTVADKRWETAATDGKHVFFSPNFFATLTEEEKVFVYAHEVMHVAFEHMNRSENRNQRLWNYATDAVINQILQKENLPMPKGCVDVKNAINYSAEEMYEILLQEKQRRQQDNQSQQQIGRAHV